MATASKVPSAKLGARAGFKAQGNQANQAYEELRDATNDGADIIESLCMQCEEQGETRLLLTKIPFFKVCVSSLIHPSHENIVPLSLSLSLSNFQSSLFSDACYTLLSKNILMYTSLTRKL